jgi:hypothetical protein
MGTTDAEHLREFPAGRCFREDSDSRDIIGGQFRPSSSLAIDGMGDRLQVGWIHTRADATQVVKFESFRNGSAMAFINNTMSIDHSPIAIGLSVSTLGHGSLPYPARGIKSSVLFNVIDRRLSSTMTQDESSRLPCNVSPLRFSGVGNRSGITASTHTQPPWVRPIPDNLLVRHLLVLPSRGIIADAYR